MFCIREWLGLSQYGYIVCVMRRSLRSTYCLRHHMHNLSVRGSPIFRGGAYANMVVWAALGSKCKCKQRNVLRNMFVCIYGWTTVLCIVIVSCLCLIKLTFTAVVTVILVNAGFRVIQMNPCLLRIRCV